MVLLSAMDFWLKAVDEGKYAGALLLDLSKAFDCVPHGVLLQELSMAGVGSRALQWFFSYLTGRFQRVYYREVATQWLPVSRGVPQGSCLSPLLFSIFVRNRFRNWRGVYPHGSLYANFVTARHSDYNGYPESSYVSPQQLDKFSRAVNI